MNTQTQPRKRDVPPQPPMAPGGEVQMRSGENPFLSDEEHILPHVPDDKDWHYCWIRWRIGNEEDSKNIFRHLNGRLPYEIVTLDNLPESARSTFQHLKLSQGQHTGRIGISDVVLARTPMPLYRKYYEATQIRANRMNDALREAIVAKNTDRMSRSRLYVEEDSEADGLMPGRAQIDMTN